MPQSVDSHMRVACLTIALAFSSCGGAPEPTQPRPPTAPTEATPPPAEAVEEVAAPPTTAAPPPGPAPTLALVATPGPDGVAISIANHGGADASLRSAVVVEVDEGGSFSGAPSSSTLALRYDCAREPEPCVTLAPGAELLPPAWLGTWGDMQCVCTRCGPVAPGRYRLVVTTCDGAHRVESNAFTLPAR